MKKTFDRIPTAKRNKIIKACIKEFGSKGYDLSSTASIIKGAGISKGGLYEYIDSKEDLYIFIVHYSYRHMYDYIWKRINEDELKLPKDILKRVHFTSSLAIDFYLAHPDYVALISKTHRVSDSSLSKKLSGFFIQEFMDLFTGIEDDSLRYESAQIIDHLAHLLLKTRYEFLTEMEEGLPKEEIYKNYMTQWDFITSILTDGIYKSKQYTS